MSEAETFAPLNEQAVDGVGPGQLLKHARETAGLHIAALAVLLKVPVKKLEALEADRFDLLPDAVFVRALASSVCRTLKVDAASVLERLPQSDAPKLIYTGLGINAPFHSPGDGPGPSVWAQASRPAMLAGLLLVLGALALIFLPAVKTGFSELKSGVNDSRVSIAGIPASNSAGSNTRNSDSNSASSVVIEDPAALRASLVITTDARLPSASEATALVTAANLTATSKISVTASSLVPAQTSSLSAGAFGVASPTFVVRAKPPSASDIVIFTAKGQSWVEATDAKGQVVLRRVLNAGEVTGAAGALPLKVVVGRASETQVQIRGKAFDVNAVAKDNVARFEVN